MAARSTIRHTRSSTLWVVISTGLLACALLALGASAFHRYLANQALGDAIDRFDRRRIGELVNRGAEVNMKSPRHESALYPALVYHDEPLAEFLLNRGADPDAGAVSNHLTLLTLAATQGRSRWVRMLLRYGAHVDRKNSQGMTALHCAACIGSSETLAVLLQAGADTNETSRDGATPLQWAACSGSEACVKMLLDHGAKVSTLGPGGLPLSNAMKIAGVATAKRLRILALLRRS